MASAAPPISPQQAAGPPALRVWSLHLLCFVLPATTLLFGLTAPHSWWVALLFFAVPVLSVLADARGGPEQQQPLATLPGWPFDSVLYALFALQLLNLWLLVDMVASHGFWRVDTLIGWQLLGITAGYSGIVVAHEMMHRNHRLMKQLSRVLMSLVLYEHFLTEHLRGHHVRVGNADDPATARYGEHYQAFFRRTLPAQFRSAWQLEKSRVGSDWLRNRVVQGLVFEWALALGALLFFGLGGFVFYLGQAFIAVRLLECVNFFEHWGLERRGARVSPQDSWDTNSRFTLYTLVGLSRHADHHAWAARPYQQLRYWEESPKLPRGYFGMVVMAFARPGRFQKLMRAELERRQLGPFAGPA